MEARVSYSLVGLFVLLLGAAIPVAGIWIAGGLGEDGEPRQRYAVYLTESASGLRRDAAVTYRGVEVGRIAEIGIARERADRIRLLLEVDPQTPIREGTTATLKVRGLTGGASLELSGGERGAPPLEAGPGERYPEIPYRESLLGQLDNMVQEGMGSLQQIAGRLEAVLSEENEAELNRLLVNAADLAEGLSEDRERLHRTLDNADRAFADTSDAASRLPRTLEEAEATMDTLEASADRVNRAGDALTDMSRRGESGFLRLEQRTLPIAEGLLLELERTSSRLRRLSERLEEDPSRLLFGPPERSPGPGEESP